LKEFASKSFVARFVKHLDLVPAFVRFGQHLDLLLELLSMCLMQVLTLHMPPLPQLLIHLQLLLSVPSLTTSWG
jgi:hypothetical protein